MSGARSLDEKRTKVFTLVQATRQFLFASQLLKGEISYGKRENFTTQA